MRNTFNINDLVVVMEGNAEFPYGSLLTVKETNTPGLGYYKCVRRDGTGTSFCEAILKTASERELRLWEKGFEIISPSL